MGANPAPFDKPFYLLLTNTIFGGDRYPITASTPSQSQIVDHVRAWQ